ncbi:MAG: MCE family protein [Deltaproteobacteria bacterium]|nr:MCE family protein [Deltaproteobacteria bacterium]MBI3295647.1 MCE family protein [Deltaproteobacteria bacterium]
METKSRDFWVGVFVILAIAMAMLFFWLMGSFSFVQSNPQYFLRFSFAGGVEVGSPVRVSGVKVGRVEKIDFLSGVEGMDRTAIEVTISVARKALAVIHEDSRFFVNIAGIIGERYIEISPGSVESPVLPPGSRIRAVDPPRIDQLLSQGYGVFGRVQEFLEQNEKSVTSFLNQLARVMDDTAKVLEKSDRKKIGQVIDNLSQITSDLRFMTEKIRGPQGEEFFDRLMVLIERAHEIDKPTLKKFFQEEGIRARVF